MGNTHSSATLTAALEGDEALIQQRMSSPGRAEKLLTATTGVFLGQKGILHVAAKHGKAAIISSVLNPLVAAVTTEIAEGAYPGGAAALLTKVVNKQDSKGRVPILAACYHGHWDCAEWLLEAGSNVFACDKDGNGVLHLAAINAHTQLVQQLLAKADTQAITGRLVSTVNLSGFSPLHYAAWSGQADVVRCLLASGADPLQASWGEYDRWLVVPLGSTALHVAATQLKPSACLAMLEHYALQVREWLPGEPVPVDPRTRADSHGSNPYHAALWKGLPPTCQLATCLNPQLDVFSIFNLQHLQQAEVQAHRGPPSLRVIAAEAAKSHLLQQLGALECLSEQKLRIHQHQEQRQRQQQRVTQQQRQLSDHHLHLRAHPGHSSLAGKPYGHGQGLAGGSQSSAAVPAAAHGAGPSAAPAAGAPAEAAGLAGTSDDPPGQDKPGGLMGRSSKALKPPLHPDTKHSKLCIAVTAVAADLPGPGEPSMQYNMQVASPTFAAGAVPAGLTAASSVCTNSPGRASHRAASSSSAALQAVRAVSEVEADTLVSPATEPLHFMAGGLCSQQQQPHMQQLAQAAAASLAAAASSKAGCCEIEPAVDEAAAAAAGMGEIKGHCTVTDTSTTSNKPRRQQVQDYVDADSLLVNLQPPRTLVARSSSSCGSSAAATPAKNTTQVHPAGNSRCCSEADFHVQISRGLVASLRTSQCSSSMSQHTSFSLPGAVRSRTGSLTGGVSAVFGANRQHVARMLKEAGALDPSTLSYKSLASHSRSGSMIAATSLAGALPGCVSDRLGHCLDSSSSSFVGHGGPGSTAGSTSWQCGTGLGSTFSFDQRSCGSVHSEVCAVCMDKLPAVALARCGHVLCFDCARCIVGEGVGCRAPLCPFCRMNITGFGLMPVTALAAACSGAVRGASRSVRITA